MRVLSLFDGMAGARMALDRENIRYDEYIGIEIDKKARELADYNYADEAPIIRPTHDVRDIDAAHKVGKVDLLVAGFPCQPFSTIGKMREFNDDRGVIYKDMLRWRDICKPDYWLLENVRPSRSTCAAAVLDGDLGVAHILVNSLCYGAQNRLRAFWTSHKFTPFSAPHSDTVADVLSGADSDREFDYHEIIPHGKFVHVVGITDYERGVISTNRKKHLRARLKGSGERVGSEQTSRVFGLDGKMAAVRTRNFHKVPLPDSPRRCRELSLRELADFQHIPADMVLSAAMSDDSNITRPTIIAAVGNCFDIAVVGDILTQLLTGNKTERAAGGLL